VPRVVRVRVRYAPHVADFPRAALTFISMLGPHVANRGFKNRRACGVARVTTRGKGKGAGQG